MQVDGSRPAPKVGLEQVADILARLIAFDTESSKSNLDLIAYVETLLAEIGVTTTTPSRHAAQHEVRSAMEHALTLLPPDYAAAVRLYDIEGLSIAEVAEKTGAKYRQAYRALTGRDL